MKTAFIGDSICAGVGASEEKMRFSSRFVRMLAGDGISARELNFGVSGSTMFASGLKDTLPRALEQSPDMIILEHGVNDNAVGISITSFLHSYHMAVRMIKKKLPECKIICMTICPSFKQHYLYERSWLLLANIGIREIACAENTLLAETFFELRDNENFFPDKIHPDDNGHEKMALSLYKAFNANQLYSKNDFDLVIKDPGIYRINNFYIQKFETHAGIDSWTQIRHLGTNYILYSSPGSLLIETPLHSYPGEPTTFTANGKSVPFEYNQAQQKIQFKLSPAIENINN